MIKKILTYVIIALAIVGIFVGIRFIKNKDRVSLDEIILNEETLSTEMFAIMIETEYNSGKYQEKTDGKWPKAPSYKFDVTKSGCIDTDGNRLSNVLQYDESTGIAKVITSKTAYCYLYFNLASAPVDNVAPTVTASVNGNNIESPTMTITSSESGTYCVNTSATTTGSCTKSGSISSSVTTSAFTTGGTYYAHVTDSAGNTGHSGAVSVTLPNYICATGTVAGTCVKSAGLTGYVGTAYNGMYRFTGTTADNYVSLSGVLYRIIGVTSTANSTLGLSANQLKLIKAESIGEYNWHTDNTTNTIWTSSSLYSNLQGSYALTNTSVIPSGWSSKISSVKWYIGDVSARISSYIGSASTIIGYEDNTVTSSTSKIGLMYLSDFYYAYIAGGTTNCYNDDCTNWMTSGSTEYTMTRFGLDTSGTLRAWTASSSVGSSASATASRRVRPVFYLNPSVTYVSGSGSESDPIILN